jgi:hypothetical protein
MRSDNFKSLFTIRLLKNIGFQTLLITTAVVGDEVVINDNFLFNSFSLCNLICYAKYMYDEKRTSGKSLIL